MLKSLFSGVSGMKGNQTKMDVIGNNIANSNTTAFKSGRVTFKDMLNQTLEGANEKSTTRGGTNPKQVGIGVSVSSIDTIMKQGALQPTGRDTDLAIEGNGFFIISDAEGYDVRYTRDGSFTLDKDGNLITSTGLYVQGILLDKATPVNMLTKTAFPADLSNLSLKPIKIQPQYTPTVSIGGFDIKVGPGLQDYKFILGKVDKTASTTATVNTTDKVITLEGNFEEGKVSPSDLATQINSALAGKIDETVMVTGSPNKNALSGEQTEKINVADYIPAVKVGGFEFSVGNELIGWKFKIGKKDDNTSTTAIVDKVNKIITIDGDFDNTTTQGMVQASDLEAKINAQLKTDGITTTIKVKGTALEGTLSGETTEEIKENLLKLVSFGIEKDGTIKGIYGDKAVVIGKVMLANFTNAAGLEKAGDNSFKKTANSGNPQVGYAGSNGYGSVNQGALEMSNVDLANEFTDMIIASRAFQANSRTITTSDEMIQELINLKR
ncbi:hypothetical protein Q428_06060 [Fervidicella metallireducens AeB]|uniref:Flagellar hook protein FlgE n=1 Tax=Fervidicella metallireducens AeB TaxID=1403537 RepID=A0A017RW37_9CLOT|nr:flagellar hook-basal body complex protein [Fervidicella metallireducens]EYE88831.1 hypothetical protein Q428_06060 [Fervidicella metallireducens AeB]